MKKEYIRTEEMKILFSLMPTLKSMKLSLDVELKRNIEFTKDEDGDYIEGMTFGDCGLSDMPFANTNETSDKTASIALSYEKQISNEYKEAKKAIKEICKEIYCIEIILDKIEIALNALNKSQREILELKFWQEYSWNDIMKNLNANKIFYSKRQLQNYVNKAVDKLRTVAMIDIEMYKNVIGLMNKINS